MTEIDHDNAVDILLVEDNPNDIELSLRALKKHGLANKVFVVKDGKEALDFLFNQGAYASQSSRQRPKVIFLDIKLPKINGLEVLRRIKNDERTRSIPVVALTSSKEERDLVESYKYGINSYISKPLQFDEFVKAISQIGYYWLLLNMTP